MEKFEDYGITIPYRRSGGNVKCTCPECARKGTRHNLKDKSLSVNIDKGVWNCHYCGWSGSLKNDKPYHPEDKPKKTYKKPVARPITELSRQLVKWFNSRGISELTLKKMKINEGMHSMPNSKPAPGDRRQWVDMNTVQFNYYLNGELVNVKYRSGDKRFMFEAGAELLPYNIDAIADAPECIITEGEMDCLSFIEAGYPNCISVPNGGGNKSAYLDEFLDGWFDDKSVIYIASDTDEKGIELRDELIRRFGAERCKIITYGSDCKDANEHLLKYGKESLQRCFKDAKDVKVDGVFTLPDYEDELDAIYKNGLKKGFMIGHSNFDQYCSFETKRLAVVTGIPGCVTGETRVAMADGTLRPIVDVEVGDAVMCRDYSMNPVRSRVVTKWDSGRKPVWRLTTGHGHSVEASGEHRFLTAGGLYVELGDLKAGDFIAASAPGHRWEEIVSVEFVGVRQTYDLEVAVWHNYVANGLVTHNSGKSEFIDEMCVRINILHDYKVGFFSPENMPIQLHAVKLIEKLCGKQLRQDDGTGNTISPGEYRNAKEYMTDNFFHILPEDGYTIDNILKKAKYLVRKYGIRVLVIDPYNRIENEQSGKETETQYISRVLDKLTNFAQQNDLLIFLMAHPTKVKKDVNGGVPTLYDINGSANFFNKADFGLVVHRDREKKYTMVRIEKVKFRHLGEPGEVKFKFNVINGRYVPWEDGEALPVFNTDNFITQKFNNSVTQQTIPVFDRVSAPTRPPQPQAQQQVPLEPARRGPLGDYLSPVSEDEVPF